MKDTVLIEGFVILGDVNLKDALLLGDPCF